MANNNAAPKALTGHLELLYPTKYVKAADLHGKDVTVVIDHAEWEQLVMAGGKRDWKVALHLRSGKGKALEKTWIVSKTVLRQIAAATGETDVANWSGKPVTMFPTTCRGADGKQVECIRVRVKVSASREDPPADMAAPVERAFADDAESSGDASDAGRYLGGGAVGDARS